MKPHKTKIEPLRIKFDEDVPEGYSKLAQVINNHADILHAHNSELEEERPTHSYSECCKARVSEFGDCKKCGKKCIEHFPEPKEEKKCKIKNGMIICYCGKCEPEDYPLPKDFPSQPQEEEGRRCKKCDYLRIEHGVHPMSCAEYQSQEEKPTLYVAKGKDIGELSPQPPVENDEPKCVRCGLTFSDCPKKRWKSPICKIGATEYDEHVIRVTDFDKLLTSKLQKQRKGFKEKVRNLPIIGHDHVSWVKENDVLAILNE